MPVPVSVLRVESAPSAIVAVTTPVVRTSTVLASATLVLPLSVMAWVPESAMPVEPVAVITAAAVPVSVVTAEALTATVVAASIVFRAPAAAVVSVTVTVYALPVPVSVANDDTSPLEMVAVTTPSVLTSMRFASATVTGLLRVTFSSPRPMMVPAAAAA